MLPVTGQGFVHPAPAVTGGRIFFACRMGWTLAGRRAFSLAIERRFSVIPRRMALKTEVGGGGGIHIDLKWVTRGQGYGDKALFRGRN